MNRKD